MSETRIENWLASLKTWYQEINENSHYRESAYCDFERTDEGQTYLNATIVLQATPVRLPERGKADHSPVTSGQDEENRATKRPVVGVTNDRPKLVNLLPTRAQAAHGKIIVRQPVKTDSDSEAIAGIDVPPARKGVSPTANNGLNSTTDFNTTVGERINLGNDLALEKSKGSESSTLNHHLGKLLVLRRPPVEAPGITHIPIVLCSDHLKNEPCLQTDAGRYGILLRAALLAKVTGSKANLSLYINRLEDIRALFAQADTLGLSLWQKAALSRALLRLLEETRLWVQPDKTEVSESAEHETEYKSTRHPIIPETLNNLPDHLRKLLKGKTIDQSSPISPVAFWRAKTSLPSKRRMSVLLWQRLKRRVPILAWYHWNRTVPDWVNMNEVRLTLTGHMLAYGAFASLIWLSLHREAIPEVVLSLPGMHQLLAWRASALPDTAALAVGLAIAAGLIYALTTKRLTLEDRFALTINDKIETVLDSILADLMKANMDVQIGRMGRGEPPGTIPESVSRKLDEIFALKELVNSYESTVRARRRHVAEEVSKEQRIRVERNQQLRNAALGVTASFVLFEIGSRIQDHRDLIAGTDPYSFSYWMSKRSSNNDAPGPLTDGASNSGTKGAHENTGTLANAPQTTLKCAYTEIKEQSPASPECLSQWRDNALGSSSQLLLLVFVMAMLIFFVRVIRRGTSQES